MSASRAWRNRVGRCLCTGSLSLLSSTAAGQTQATGPVAATERSFALEYHASPNCPDGLALVSAIQARTAGAALVSAEAAAVRVEVELRPDGQTLLWVRLVEGSFRREFSSESCVDAVASLAVIVSMVLEAEPASRRAMAEGTVPLEQPEPAPASPPPTPPPPSEPAATSAPAAAAATKSPARSPATPPLRPHGQPRRTFGFALSGSGALETAVAPTPPPGAAIGIEAWGRPSRVVAPGVVADFLATTTATETTVEGHADFQLLAGRLHACLLRVPLSSTARLIPCGLFEAGSLRAAGGGRISNPQRVTMPWVAGGLALRAQWDIVRGLALEGSGSAKGLMFSDTFIFLPRSPVYQVPRFSFGLGLGLSLRVH